MKKEFFSVSPVFLSIIFVLCFTSFCFGGGIDGYFWKKMDKVQKSLFIMGYKMGSFDAGLALNGLVNLRKELKKESKPSDEMKIADAYCTRIIELTRKAFMRETQIPEENLENIVEELDVFYTRERNLKVRISEAISKVREEMWKKNPKLEEIIKY